MEKINYTVLSEINGYEPKVEAAKIRAKLDKKIFLFMPNYYRHIKKRHPDVTIDIIVDMLTDPDMIFKRSKSAKEFYYHKTIGGKEFKVIIVPFDKNHKKVITAYSVLDEKPLFDIHRAYCSYERDSDLFEEYDYDFFCNAFDDSSFACEA